MDLLLGMKRKYVQMKSFIPMRCIDISSIVMLVGLITCLFCTFCPLEWLSSTILMTQTRHMAITYICLALFFFFLVVAVGTLITGKCIMNTSVQNGQIMFTFLAMALAVGLFSIPNNQHSTVSLLCMFASLLGGFFFILLQPILHIDFIVCRIEPWMKRLDETNVTFQSWSFTVSVIGYLLCFITIKNLSSLNQLNDMTGGGDCSPLVPLIIQFNLASSLGFLRVYIVTMLYCILRYIRPVLLVATTFALYVLFITWSAMSNATDLGCQQQFSAFTRKEGWTLHVQLFLQLLIWLLSLVNLKIRTDDLGFLQSLVSNEYVGIVKRYQSSTFLLGFALASLHLMMVLTDYIRLRADEEVTGQILLSYFGIYNELLFWMKMIALALCIFLYVFSLIAIIIHSIVKLCR